MVLELEDLSQKAEKVSGPQNTMKREMMGRKRLFTVSLVTAIDCISCKV